MEHIIGIMAMFFGFVSMLIHNYAGAYGCFGYAFILWVVMAIQDTRTPKEREGVKSE